MTGKPKSRPGGTRQLTDPPSGRGYDVGYKKPPVKTRFQPGQSGNPRGRPSGSQNHNLNDEETLAEIIREESKRLVNVHQAGQVINLTSERAVVRSMIGRAIQGNPSAQRAFISLQSMLNTTPDDGWTEKLAILVAYKNGWRKVLDEHKSGGKSLPLPDPPPERIEIDEDNRTAYLVEEQSPGAKNKRRKQAFKRKLGAEDYDWLMRHTPYPSEAADLSPQPLLGREDLDRLPDHIRARLYAGLKGIQDYVEGKFVSIMPPRPIYDSKFVTPCGHEMPLHGMRSYVVEQEDAEILLTQGWTLCDPDQCESGSD